MYWCLQIPRSTRDPLVTSTFFYSDRSQLRQIFHLSNYWHVGIMGIPFLRQKFLSGLWDVYKFDVSIVRQSHYFDNSNLWDVGETGFPLFRQNILSDLWDVLKFDVSIVRQSQCSDNISDLSKYGHVEMIVWLRQCPAISPKMFFNSKERPWFLFGRTRKLERIFRWI